jgi:tRNA (cmo5U34)-methyltransferase
MAKSSIKSSMDEIKKRFDGDVARFSNLETGQTSVIDATIALEVGTEAAKRVAPGAKDMLDIGCGAGNWTLKTLLKIPNMNCTLLDISSSMLAKAKERAQRATTGKITIIESDMREAELGENAFDIIVAAASLHHLRTDAEWEGVFSKIARALKKGGCFIISDLVKQNDERLSALVYEGWARYLEETGGPAFRDEIISLSKKEDTPRPVNYLAYLLQKNGWTNIESLHKNMCFATLCAIK